MIRARAANLMVYVSSTPSLTEIHEMLQELTAAHPSRVLTICGETKAPDQDIEMFVSALSQKEKQSGVRRLCCEEVTLKAQGSFIAELPSAALPLLVSDLPTFLWWRATIDNQKVFNSLLHASDRLIIDSVEFQEPLKELLAVRQLFQQEFETELGISDLNWARLTSWRGLLADFYDVPDYRAALDSIDRLVIDYVAPDTNENAIAPQALLMAGWLASRLQWTITDKPLQHDNERTVCDATTLHDHNIAIELNRVSESAVRPGRLTRVELQARATHNSASFKVARSTDRKRVITEAKLGAQVQPGRVLPVRNRSTAQLLGRELEILCNDQIYQEALAVGASLIERGA